MPTGFEILHERANDLFSQETSGFGAPGWEPNGALQPAHRTDSAPLRRIGVRVKDRFQVLKLNHVDCIEAYGNYSHLFIGARVWTIRESLGNLERRLDPKVFFRAHRSWIVNLDRISEILIQNPDPPYAILQGGRRVPIGPKSKSRLFGLLGIV